MAIIDDLKIDFNAPPSDTHTVSLSASLSASAVLSESPSTTSNTTSTSAADENLIKLEGVPADYGNGSVSVISKPAPSFSFSAKPVDWLQQGKTVN